ncbi:NBS-containing resistance-like protein, partial [Trifolium medium]|nr:NBS-containing resistance-like protein [Trifolium medium]
NEPLPELEVQPSSNVKREPSLEDEVQPSPDVKMDPSLVVKNEPLPKTRSTVVAMTSSVQLNC